LITFEPNALRLVINFGDIEAILAGLSFYSGIIATDRFEKRNELWITGFVIVVGNIVAMSILYF
jgi:hypothetical protein